MSELGQLEAARLMMTEAIAEMSDDEQQAIQNAKEAFQGVLDTYGDVVAFTALSIFGIEKQIEMIKADG